MGTGFPPDGQVRAHLAQRQALVEQRMAKDLLSHLAKQLYSVQCTRRSLLSDGLDVQRRVHRRVCNKDQEAGVRESAEGRGNKDRHNPKTCLCPSLNIMLFVFPQMINLISPSASVLQSQLVY